MDPVTKVVHEKSGCRFAQRILVTFILHRYLAWGHAKRPGFVASMKKLDRRRKPEVHRITRRDLAASNVQEPHQRIRGRLIFAFGLPLVFL